MAYFQPRYGRSYSAAVLAGSSSPALTTVRRDDVIVQSYYRASPYGIRTGPLEIRSFADDDHVGDSPYEYWPGKLKYCDVYKRKWIGYSELHKYWKNPFGWERGLPRYSIAYPAAGWRSFKRYRYAINPPLVRIP